MALSVEHLVEFVGLYLRRYPQREIGEGRRFQKPIYEKESNTILLRITGWLEPFAEDMPGIITRRLAVHAMHSMSASEIVALVGGEVQAMVTEAREQQKTKGASA